MKSHNLPQGTVAVLSLLACLTARSILASVYVVQSGETLTVTDATVSQYADGIQFADKTGVVEFNTSGPPTMDISGAGTVIKTKNGWWGLAKATAGYTVARKQPNFSGDYILRGGGTVELHADLGEDRSGYFGNEKGTFYIESNNGLQVSNSTDVPDVKLFGSKRVVAAGTGSGSYGGFIRTLYADNKSCEFLNNLTLSGDATLNLQGAYNLYVGDGLFDMNGHTLTIGGSGKGSLVFAGALTNGASGAICYTSGLYNQYASVKIASPDVVFESSTTPYVIHNYGGFSFYYRDGEVKDKNPVRRPLTLTGDQSTSHHGFIGIEHDATSEAALASPTTFANPNANVWEGDITIPSGNSLDIHTTLPQHQFTVKGQISGAGSVSIGGPTGVGFTKRHCGRVYFANRNNTYTGATQVNNRYDSDKKMFGQFLAEGPHSIPDFSKFTAEYGVVGLRMKEREDAGEVLWTDGTYISDLATQGSFGPNSGNHLECSLGLDATFCDGAFTLPAIDGMFDWPVWLGGCGMGRVIMTGVTGTASKPIHFHHRGGEFVVKTVPGQKHYLGEIRVSPPNGGVTNSVLTFEDCDLIAPTAAGKLTLNAGYAPSAEGMGATVRLKNTRLVAENFNFSTESYDADVIHPGGYIGYGVMDCGCLEICDGSVVTGRLVVGGIAYGARGAVFQYGGKVVALGRTGTEARYSSQIGGGDLSVGDNNGYYELRGGEFVSLGTMAIGMYEGGYLAQYGGTFRLDRALGDTSDDARFYVATGNSQAKAVALRVAGGTFDVGPGRLGFNAGWSGLNQYAHILVDGTGYLNAGSKFFWSGGYREGAITRYALADSGRLRIGSVSQANATTELSVNFNGGTWECSANNAIYSGDIFHCSRNDSSYHPAEVYVYSGGATIDTAGYTGNCTYRVIQGAYGGGVTGLDSTFTPFASAFEPIVRIDGDGKGAVAVAEWSRETQMVTGIRMKSPGVGYTSARVCFCYGRVPDWRDYYIYCTTNAAGGITGIKDFDPYFSYYQPTVEGYYGGGTGAAITMTWDKSTHMVTGYTVTATGSGYTNPYVYINPGKKYESVSHPCTIAENANTGSFAKAGEGTFTLYAANTWGGETVVKGGTLKAAANFAIPTASKVVLAGGVMDFGGTRADVGGIVYRVGAGVCTNAENVTFAENPVIEITTEELAAGKAVALSESMDLSGVTLRITGDASLLESSRRYDVVTTTGTFTGSPTFETDPSLRRWHIGVRASRIYIGAVHGFTITFR